MCAHPSGTRAEGPILSNPPNDRNVLLADDGVSLRDLLEVLPAYGFRCAAVAGARDALAGLDDGDFHVLVADMDMPGEEGYELAVDLADRFPDVGVVIVARGDDAKLVDAALRLGAGAYLAKPVVAGEVVTAVAAVLRRRELEIESRDHRRRLEQMVRDRTNHLWEVVAELEQAGREARVSRAEMIRRLSLAAELKDDETTGHIQRMSRYCHVIANSVGLDEDRCELIRVAAQLHDIGKIGLPDDIVMAQGSLVPAERAVMQTHTEIGYRILSGSGMEVLDLAATIAYTHHERYGGSGYPRRLAGERIPLEGRIAAIADVFDALTTHRRHRRALPFDRAVATMRAGRGTEFDPDLLDVFLHSLNDVVAIRQGFADRSP